MQKTKCYIYTRVSTAIQVDGFSLEAQKNALMEYAERNDMVIVGEYSDEGKSGKSINGRPDFMRMLRDIRNGKDKVSFVALMSATNIMTVNTPICRNVWTDFMKKSTALNMRFQQFGTE